MDIDSYGGICTFGNCIIDNNKAQQYAGGDIGGHIVSYENKSIITCGTALYNTFLPSNMEEEWALVQVEMVVLNFLIALYIHKYLKAV